MIENHVERRFDTPQHGTLRRRSNKVRELGETRLRHMIQIHFDDALLRHARCRRQRAPIFNPSSHLLGVPSNAQRLTARKDQSNGTTGGDLNLFDKRADTAIRRGGQGRHDDHDVRLSGGRLQFIEYAPPIVAIVNESEVVPGDAIHGRRPRCRWRVDF